MATIKDVAHLAGVAVSTASYALSGDTKVSSKTKAKVLEAAKQLNYQKNGFAMDLKRTRTNTIALFLSDLSGPFYSELIKGVQDVSLSKGYDLIACSSVGGNDSTAIRFLKEKRVDGAIIFAHNIDDHVILESAREGFPIIVLERGLVGEYLVNVTVDNEHGGFIATQHLIEQGHTEIGFVGGPANSFDSQMRYVGFKKALAANNLAEYAKWNVTGNFTRDSGYLATKMLLLQGELPSAIFYANDEMAIGGLKAFDEQRVRVPQDVSIIGFDDIALSEYVTPKLSTVRQPKYEVGTLAAHLLFQIVGGEFVNKQYKLSTELVQRNSCMHKT
ncbi:LacI family transcriptional regulator [Cohnella kolymensis]|uniref:LacI family transcriptional regulator n=1 Tax=Cohnella kolymensis TaxID=1590652 RepID=A0ABR5A6U6_9BACL|nr:LacI family DNA-binding transcriptional regulator [Cohnella kolymensis]KIL36637.1 LacI family transcriptional regulator [Cohnella kolymensis]